MCTARTVVYTARTSRRTGSRSGQASCSCLCCLPSLLLQILPVLSHTLGPGTEPTGTARQWARQVRTQGHMKASVLSFKLQRLQPLPTVGGSPRVAAGAQQVPVLSSKPPTTDYGYSGASRFASQPQGEGAEGARPAPTPTPLAPTVLTRCHDMVR